MTSILKVNQIQNTAGTTALEIDSSGRILQPARPAFSVYQSTTLNPVNYDSGTKVSFDTKDFDIGNNVTLNSSAVFTAPINGIYHFGCNVMVNAIESSSFVSLSFYIDDAEVNNAQDLSYRYLEDNQGGAYQTAHSSGLIQLTANQTVTPYIRVLDDTTVSLRDGARFFGYLVG
jgi:hypothetical protein